MTLAHTTRQNNLWSSKALSAAFFLCMLSSFLFTACGDDGTTENVTNITQMGVEVVASVEDLPKCEKDNQGEQALVKGESSVRVCVDGKWFVTKESTKDTVYVEDGDFSCTTKELKDKSGLKIVCNGDSIGVVLNGEKGADGTNGTNGDDGAGCAVVEQTDSTVVINCGGQTMTLNLGSAAALDSLEPDSERHAVSLDTLAGVSQKGPFLKGSTVYLYELSDGRTLKQTNGNFVSNITSDDGRFRFTTRNLMSQYALIVVDGKYRNEVTGDPTNTSIRLQAYTDVLNRKNANVNLLTQLEMNRVYYLVTREKKRFKVAKHQAQMEILDAFHIDTTIINKSSEDLNVFGDTEADAALLAISILLQGDSSETALSVLLSEIADDMESDGKWDDSVSKARIAEWALAVDTVGKLAEFRSHVQDWGLGSGKAPNFEKYMRIFWSKELGLGVCGNKNNPVGTVRRVSNPNSTKYYAEKYTDTMSVGGKIRFTCVDADSAKWRVAENLEKDRFDWNPDNAEDGSLFNGQITGLKMVWDKDTLRYASESEIYCNKGCTSYNENTFIKVDESEFAEYGYMCDTNSSLSSFVTVKRKASKFGTMTDVRNDRTYYTIKIGKQTWMAENLDFEYKVDGVSYGNVCNADDCKVYGRYYYWSAAMDSAGVYSENGKGCGYGKTCIPVEPVRGICPEGWHLPNSVEWDNLYSAMGSSPSAMQARGVEAWPNATDAYGFSALPADRYNGYDNKVTLGLGFGKTADFWGPYDRDGSSASHWSLSEKSAAFNDGNYNKFFAYPVRCVQDAPAVP